MADPTWYPAAAARLAAGTTIKATARALALGEKTLHRHLHAPAGALARLVEAARAERDRGAADELAPLRAMSRELITKEVQAGNLDAALRVFAKTTTAPDAPSPQEDALEPEVSIEEAAREVASALRELPDLFRAGGIARDVLEEVREAARALLADDLRPRPPVDVEAERVEPAAQVLDRAADDDVAAVVPVVH